MQRWLLLFTVFVAGCGGGGGGGGSAARSLGDTCPGYPAGNLHYSTAWGTSPADASQVVTLYDAAGNAVYSEDLERTAGSELTIQQFPASVYELRSSLFKGPLASGQLLGVASVVVDMCGSGAGATVNVATTYATKAQSLRLSPAVTRLNQQQTKRFVATGAAGGGQVAFLPPGSVSWTTSGGVGTINSTGVFTAKAAGTGLVVGTVSALGLSANAQVTVDPFNPKKGKWTVLVYMNAANDLAPDSDLNINQMESVAGNTDVRFVVQWKESRIAFPSSTFDGVRRYLILPDTDPNTIHSQLVQDNIVDTQGNPLDMGSPQTMLDFINWGKTYYPADRYVLVIWNHGAGWKKTPDQGTRGFSYDDQYGTHIETWQLDQALGTNHFDIIGWDASLMQMLEVGYEMRSHADYIVGSEESPPAEGYPYDTVFQAFRDTPDAATSVLSKGFVDGMLNDPLYANRKITQSVLDASKLGSLASAVDGFGTVLFNNKSQIASVIQQIRNDGQRYSWNSSRYFYDIGDLCSRFMADGSVPAEVKTAAAAVQSAEQAAMVWEGHNAYSPGSTGISIDYSPGTTFQSYRSDYIQLKLAKDTYWDEFLGAAP